MWYEEIEKNVERWLEEKEEYEIEEEREYRERKKEQQKGRYPFYEEGLEPRGRSEINYLSIIGEVEREKYKYIGIKELKRNIYSEREILREVGLIDEINIIDEDFLVGDIERIERGKVPIEGLYWEFRNGAEREEKGKIVNDIKKAYKNERYLYIEIRKEITKGLEKKIPKLGIWGKRGKIIRPNKKYVERGNIERWREWYELLGREKKHPFMPSMIWTGRVTKNGDGELIYEYKEIESYYGRMGRLYRTNIRPIDLDYPLGIPIEGEIEKDICLREGLYPSEGIYPIHIGKYTGYKTNKKYDEKIYYVYERENGEVFLLESEPREEGEIRIRIIEEELYKESGIEIVIEDIEEWRGIEDKECGGIIALIDYTCIPNNIKDIVINECIIESLGIEDLWFIDNIIINDKYYIGDCDEFNNNPFLWNDINEINQRHKIE